LNHLVESTVFPLELVFEQRNYIPSMLFFVPLAIGFCALLERYANKRSMQTTISAFVVFLLIGLGHSTFMRNFTWKSQESLWIDAAQKAPDQFRVHYNLAVYYENHGYKTRAIKEYKKALGSRVLYRKDETAYYHIGKVYYELKHYEKAESFYQKALHMKPDFSYALAGLALVYDKKGDNELFQKYLTKAIKANPGDPFINLNMGLYFLKNGTPDKAIYHFRLSMKDGGLRKRGLLYLGIAYKQKGRLGRARAYFRESARAGAHNITPHLHLAEIYCKTGYETKARQEAETILDFFTHNKNLFYQTIDLISKKGNARDVQLSACLLLPLISRACNGKAGHLNEWKAYLKKTLEKEKVFK